MLQHPTCTSLVKRRMTKSRLGCDCIRVSIRVCENELGDINGDGSLNVQDVIIIVTQYILISEYNEIADLNGDGSVNIQDIIMLVSIITG